MEIPRGVCGVALVVCFVYGDFDIEAKLPTVKNLRPAFWMSPFESLPPEIDVFEAYSKNKEHFFHFDIFNPFGFWRVETNFHCGKQPDNYNLGAKTHWLGWKNPAKHFNKLGCLWTADTSKIFYNDRLVRELKDPKLLEEYRGKSMTVKIHSHVYAGVYVTNPPTSEYVVRNFKYEPLDIK